jgi:hypothetical protein
MEDRERMAAEAVAIYEELFETFKGRLVTDRPSHHRSWG